MNLKQKRGKEYVIDKKTNMLENCKSFGQSQRDGRSADRQSKKISKIANVRQNYFEFTIHLSDCFLFCDFIPIGVEDIKFFQCVFLQTVYCRRWWTLVFSI